MSRISSLSRGSLIWIPLMLAASSLLTLGAIQAIVPPGCQHVAGKLYNSPGGELPGRMIGGISGDYWFTQGGEFCLMFPADDDPISFACNKSTVIGARGELYLKEYSAIDFSENVGTNGAVLIMVQGGTGVWENASGHIVLSGYFHVPQFQGEWSYQGEICRP